MHPVNLAYEAATADIQDFNLIDPFHLTAYNKATVNYNRDVEIFPVLKSILEKITGNKLVYQSPTDMGVNKAGFAIVDDEVVKEAAKQELIRRYFRYNYESILGIEKKETVDKIRLLMEEVKVKLEDRTVVEPARKAAGEPRKEKLAPEISSGAAIELKDGKIVTGKNSLLMSSASALVLNAIKQLADIPDRIHLLSLNIIEHIKNLKKDILGLKQETLDLEETLICLSMSSATNPTAELAMEKLRELEGCEVHLTHIPSAGDETGLRRLRVNLTSDANFSSRDLFLE
jgi:uncharacterized protein (UPF0371 family)